MEATVQDGLQEFVAACREIGEVAEIEDADWKDEIGALREVTAEIIPNPPVLLFDSIKGYPKGFRVAGLLTTSYRRSALALGLPIDKPRDELRQLASRKLKEVKPVAPVKVTKGPLMENVLTGDQVNLWLFPVPLFHSMDGGRYIGTGDCLINRDQESGFINMGTYRMQVHEKNVLGLWMSPGQHGRVICERYWTEGKSCPAVATFGQDPLTFMAAHTRIPWGYSEFQYAGGLRGRPVEVIEGPVTGLPIPAHAEIAIEGEIPPPRVEARDEGPFGEWPGYYSGGTLGTGEPQPVIRVKVIYYRNNPIIHGDAPMWPGARQEGLAMGGGRGGVADLQRAGLPDVVGVGSHMGYIRVVAIRQRYPGHAKQVALAVAANSRNGRWIVVVDEDVEPTDLKEVLWAMTTRVDPAKDIEILDGCWSTPLDPLMSPEKRKSGDYTNSLAIFYAVRPFHWRNQFPAVSRSPRELRRQMVEKYRSKLSFPPM